MGKHPRTDETAVRSHRLWYDARHTPFPRTTDEGKEMYSAQHLYHPMALEYLVQNTPDDFNVYTGEDAQALSAKAVGANGVISVTSHIYGREMRKMYDALESGDVETAGDMMRFLTPKVQALFMYPSPSCVKAILNVQGFGAGDCRLPILSLNDEEKATLASKLGVSRLEDIPVDGTEMARS